MTPCKFNNVVLQASYKGNKESMNEQFIHGLLVALTREAWRKCREKADRPTEMMGARYTEALSKNVAQLDLALYWF